jgi:hypothetical protein
MSIRAPREFDTIVKDISFPCISTGSQGSPHGKKKISIAKCAIGFAAEIEEMQGKRCN